MKHILQIEVSSNKLSFILDFFKSISFIKKVEVIESISEIDGNNFETPDWHKDIIQARRKTDRKEYLPLSSLDNQIKLSK